MLDDPLRYRARTEAGPTYSRFEGSGRSNRLTSSTLPVGSRVAAQYLPRPKLSALELQRTTDLDEFHVERGDQYTLATRNAAWGKAPESGVPHL